MMVFLFMITTVFRPGIQGVIFDVLSSVEYHCLYEIYIYYQLVWHNVRQHNCQRVKFLKVEVNFCSLNTIDGLRVG